MPSPPPERYSETLQFLYGLRPTGDKIGLETTLELAALHGNPHRDLTFIHVAGTNGKGSTCAMLESIYRHSNLKVGLYTSPHLSAFGERIQINRHLLPPATTVQYVDRIRQSLPQLSTSPSFFELLTILAVSYFKEEQCDLVIWETGLGGRLDSTNIVTPAASIITPIGLDHQQWLGNTLEKIAREKAGIIKPGVPVITSVTTPSLLQILQSTADEQGAPLHQVTPNSRLPLDPSSLQLSLPGSHQVSNAALAIKATQLLAEEFPVTADDLKTGLENTYWPGRCEFAKDATGRMFLLDGAHNPSAALALIETLESKFPTASPTLIIGMFEDKQIEEVTATLAQRCQSIYTTPVESDRTVTSETLASLCKSTNPAAAVHSCESLETAIERSGPAELTIITGSLHLIGQARDLLGLNPDSPNERGLNAWTSKNESSSA